MTTSSLEPLTRFRQQMYQLFKRRRDALFDLTDALLTNGQAVERLLAQYPLEIGEPIYAVDASVWARCDAETGPQRAFYYLDRRHGQYGRFLRGPD